jgi:hypothetical protein
MYAFNMRAIPNPKTRMAETVKVSKRFWAEKYSSVCFASGDSHERLPVMLPHVPSKANTKATRQSNKLPWYDTRRRTG